MEADIAAHEVCFVVRLPLSALWAGVVNVKGCISFYVFFFQDRITDLQAQTQHFAEVGHFDADSLQDKSRQIADRYDK